MVLETTKNKICMHQLVEKKQDEITVEGDMIVNDVKPDILSIVSANGIACVYKKEVIDGKVKLDGSVNTYIIYLANDENGSYRTLNTVLDFSYVLESNNCKSEMVFNENIEVEKIECKVINERKVNIKAFLKMDGELYLDEDIDIISKIEENEDIQVLNTKKEVNSLIGKAYSKVYAKDTLRIKEDNNLAEIMGASINIINKSMKVSYNKILAKSDLEAKLVYLTEDNRICKDSIIIPVMGFVDMENISEENSFDIEYNLKNLIIKPNSGEDNSVYIEAEIEIICFAFEQKEITLIEDMYSVFKDLSFTSKKVETVVKKGDINETVNIDKSIIVPEIENAEIYNINITSKINSYSVLKSKVKYETEFNLEILFNNNNKLEVKNVLVPYDFEISSDLINEKDDIKNIISMKDKTIDITGSNIDLNGTIEVNIKLFRNEKLNIIDDVSVEELRCKNDYSMVIYFVKKGDTLWEIAKRFKSTIEDITRINNIEDPNKINVGQQLYIPKYIKKCIA